MFKLLPADGIINVIEVIARENPVFKTYLLDLYAKIKERGWIDRDVKGNTVRMVRLTEPEIIKLKELYESVI